MTPLIEREREYLAIALSNYSDVQTHLPHRVEALLNLALKLGIRPDLFSKGLRKAFEARVKADSAGARTPAGGHS